MKATAFLRRLGSALSARFDSAALQAPAPPAGPVAAVPPAWQRWCLDALRHTPRPPAFAMALAGGAEPGRLAAAQALALGLDGSLALQSRAGMAGRLALRLRVKLQDARWWRQRRDDDIWDCGHAIDTPAGLLALAAFRPRRPTLIVVEAPSAALREALGRLAQREPDLPHPVRLLVLWPHGAWPGPGTPPHLDWGPGP